MSAALFSRDWYRVAELKPRLRRFVDVHPHVYRAERWYVLQDRMSGQFRRLSPAAYTLVGLMDGATTLDDIWRIGADRLGDRLPSHEELLQLVASLYQSNLVRVDAAGDAGELLRRENEQTVRRWLAKLRSPLAVQIPMVDPEAFLAKTERFAAPFFSRTFGAVCVVLTVLLGVNAWRYWEPLTANLAERALAAENLFLMLIVYPIIKLVHELGHAYAVRRGGGEVHEMGVMLLVFFPVPYVDASASTAFASPVRRMVVGAAGIIVELVIASLAMAVWIFAEPGLARSLAFNVVLVAGLSTLLFNGNPLLRFDAYYVLADYLQIPNLSQRANQYCGYLTKRYLFGLRQAMSPARDPRERAWLLGYGVTSYIYRVFISFTIVLFIAGQYFALGVLLAVWTVAGVWAWPISKALAKPFREPEYREGTRPPWLVMGVLGTAVLVVLLVLPLPLTTTVEGAVSGGERSQVVAAERCLVNEVLAAERSTIAAGTALIRCDDRVLETRRRVMAAQLAQMRARQREAYADPVQLKLLADEARRLDEQLADQKRRIADLLIRAPRDGVLTLPGHADLPGRFFDRGTTLGWVVAADAVRIQVMVPESDVQLVRDNVRAASLRFAGELNAELPLAAWQVSPGATRELLAPVLSDQAGGSIAVVPSDDAPMTAQNFFVADVELAEPAAAPLRLGERVYVRFEHAGEPVGFRLQRWLRRTFLTYFDV